MLEIKIGDEITMDKNGTRVSGEIVSVSLGKDLNGVPAILGVGIEGISYFFTLAQESKYSAQPWDVVDINVVEITYHSIN